MRDVNKKKFTDKKPTLDQIIQSLRKSLPELKEHFGVASLGVFGSFVHGEDRSRSDLDLLVDFDPMPTLIQLSALQRHLTSLVGIHVDLVVRRTLKPVIGKRILSEVIYV